MNRSVLRRKMARLLKFLGIPLLAAATTVALTAVPAHASLIYYGNFNITFAGECAAVQNNGTTNKTPIQMASCNGTDAQKWAIFLATDTNTYWILAYAGAFPLNKCMDRGDSPGLDHMWIYGCHGGSQQRWLLDPTFLGGQQIVNPGLGANNCVGFKPSNTTPKTLAIQPCISSFPPFTQAPFWTLVPV